MSDARNSKTQRGFLPTPDRWTILSTVTESWIVNVVFQIHFLRTIAHLAFIALAIALAIGFVVVIGQRYLILHAALSVMGAYIDWSSGWHAYWAPMSAQFSRSGSC
ncbi:membrane protein [Rhodopirellula sallentina SM41]|uniref:Membrane protein n=1 Tax=Rhodopirellula sallentina SM41 TaxID=1263870 RepID=M5U0A4_9BACT|nr:membrane protein [Rhodopirellula sallentina SM41]